MNTLLARRNDLAQADRTITIETCPTGLAVVERSGGLLLDIHRIGPTDQQDALRVYAVATASLYGATLVERIEHYTVRGELVTVIVGESRTGLTVTLHADQRTVSRQPIPSLRDANDAIGRLVDQYTDAALAA